jgi:hypothetical protein
MSNAIIRLYIFGNGVNKFLYAACESSRLNGYNIGNMRSSFERSGSNSNRQSQTIQTALNENAQESESDDLRSSKNSSTDNAAVPVIKPQFSVKIQNATVTHLCGCQNTLAYCAIDGKVRFYSQFNNRLVAEFCRNVSYPLGCHMYVGDQQGNKQLCCDVGFQDGAAFTYNILLNQSKQIGFYQVTDKGMK